MKSVMVHDFSRIPKSEISVSTFDRSHGVKTAFDSGYLVPIYVDEVVPSDTFQVRASMLAKMLSPMVSAPMDNIFLDTHWFFVPSRLVWNNFTRLMGERKNPNDSIDYLVPQITAPTSGFDVGSLADYFGIPTGVGGLKVNALPFRAYAKIWDDWYRAEQLQDSIIKTFDDLGDGNPNNIDWNTLLRRGKRHDYFTSCLPSPQLGAGVELPLGTSAPVKSDGKPTYFHDISTHITMPLWTSGDRLGVNLGTVTESNLRIGDNASGRTGLVADLSQATAATINSLRMAFQVQRMLERDSRSGTRYVEIIRSHFNTICPDARLQRSEYLGGSSQLINIHQQFQTSSTDNTTPQGNRVSTAEVFSSVNWTKSFTEHGYIIGLANIRCDLNYQQGLNRMWSRRTRYDFYWPSLAHLGEQAVLNKEIYADGSADDDKVFGYQERYAEYRYHPSLITGKLRSTANGSLDIWHLAQHFTALPTLSSSFIQDNPPLSRVLAVDGEPQFIFDGYIDCKCTRPMPLYAIPGLIDHL